MKMRLLIAEHEIFTTTSEKNRGVINFFTKQQATPEQAHDLLNARQIGEQGYLNYVKYHLLQLPSVETPIQCKQLLTMAPARATKRRLSQQQRE